MRFYQEVFGDYLLSENLIIMEEWLPEIRRKALNMKTGRIVGRFQG